MTPTEPIQPEEEVTGGTDTPEQQQEQESGEQEETQPSEE